MELPVLDTNNQKVVINMDLYYAKPCNLRIIGVDADNEKTVFFNRIANPDVPGTFNIDFPLPVSPKKLKVSMFLDGQQGDVIIKSMGSEFLNPVGVDCDQEDIEAIKFFRKFCERATFLPTGEYRAQGLKPYIVYSDYIIDAEHGKLTTPARVDHDSGEIQISREMFKTYTVPQRMVILTHEYSHWKYDNTDETFCDLNALRICLGLGFPKSECIYTFTNILNDDHESNNRLQHIVNYITNFKQY
jgi:hypothetical protein